MDIDPGRSSVIAQIILILLLTAINAFFAASEMAIVSVNKTRIHHLASEGNKKAQLVEQLIKEPTSFLSTIQVGITLAGFFASASAATGFSQDLGKVFTQMNVPYGSVLAMIIVTMGLSFITLIFGELVPKRIALQKCEKLAMNSARTIVIISKIASPFIKILSWTTKVVLRILGMNDENIEENLSREEIRSMVEAGQENGVFNETETEMINSIFEFDDILAEKIMTPRTDVFCVDIEDPVSEYLDELMTMRYTRIPVYEDSIDNIIGILNIKDFAAAAQKSSFKDVDIRSILRKPYFVPEGKNIDDLFKELQRNRQHIAILIDEYGGFSGIVTIEDLIEEIMGEIEDEFDQEEVMLKKIDNHTYELDGSMEIEDINEELGLSLSNEEHDTINGYLLDMLGFIPALKDHPKLDEEQVCFEVIGMDGNRITKVKATLKAKQEIPTEASHDN
ncbi:MAG: hemolysin family protein [Erysipelotrichaceae bacterium]